jgi:hypothetical protein
MICTISLFALKLAHRQANHTFAAKLRNGVIGRKIKIWIQSTEAFIR